MSESQRKNPHHLLGVLIFLLVSVLGSGIQGCRSTPAPSTSQSTTPAVSPTETLTPPVPSPTQETILSNPTDSAITEDSDVGYDPIWGNFPPPSIDPATAIPTPLKGLDVPDEVLIWVLLGSDTEPPFKGRTEAIHLVFIHPRFSKASLISIPGDLYVYIPGYTMQRLNTAYALGGIDTLRETLKYNFGISPSRFVLAHPGDFLWLVNDLGGIDVTVFYPIPQACGGIRPGLVKMDGQLALCYASYRDGMDEVDRMQRQQQLLQRIFQKFTADGNLIKLPVLYASYKDWVITDLSLSEVMGYIPLALRLADQDRIGYYMLGWEQIQLWEIPGYSQAQVFLPNENAIKNLLQQAIYDIIKPEPLTNKVQTLEAQLTAAYLATPTPLMTPTPSPTPTASETKPGTATMTTTPGQTQTLTPTPTGTATIEPQGYP